MQNARFVLSYSIDMVSKDVYTYERFLETTE